MISKEQRRIKTIKQNIILLPIVLLCVCCSKPGKVSQPVVAAPFCADSAYRYIDEQVAFGARVPGTLAHRDCYRYLVEQLRRFGADVETQQGTMINYAGEEQPVVNIIGHFGQQTGKRPVLLCAHWDCRPWADEEDDYADRMTPVLGANDAASGVGVLLEVARQLSLSGSERPVDIVFFDCEDMGTPDFYTGLQRENTWCLGSQMFSRQLPATDAHRSPYRYGILLDMVASPDAVFYREYYSEHFASSVLDELWSTAAALGYGRFFRQEQTYPITDDHYYLNTIGKVPCVDIIHYTPHGATGFPSYWHTRHDDMTNVSVNTLDAVGKTVMTTLIH